MPPALSVLLDETTPNLDFRGRASNPRRSTCIGSTGAALFMRLYPNPVRLQTRLNRDRTLPDNHFRIGGFFRTSTSLSFFPVPWESRRVTNKQESQPQ